MAEYQQITGSKSKLIVLDDVRQATMNDIRARDYSFFVISIQK